MDDTRASRVLPNHGLWSPRTWSWSPRRRPPIGVPPPSGCRAPPPCAAAAARTRLDCERAGCGGTVGPQLVVHTQRVEQPHQRIRRDEVRVTALTQRVSNLPLRKEAPPCPMRITGTQSFPQPLPHQLTHIHVLLQRQRLSTSLPATQLPSSLNAALPVWVRPAPQQQVRHVVVPAPAGVLQRTHAVLVRLVHGVRRPRVRPQAPVHPVQIPPRRLRSTPTRSQCGDAAIQAMLAPVDHHRDSWSAAMPRSAHPSSMTVSSRRWWTTTICLTTPPPPPPTTRASRQR